MSKEDNNPSNLEENIGSAGSPSRNKQKVGILYSDAKREYFPTEELYITEAEVEKRAKEITPYFEKLGYEVTLFAGNNELPVFLKSNSWDFVLNLVDSVQGKEHLAATIPATLELLNISYSGTGVLGMAINSNKFLTKKLLEQAGLPLPRYQLFNSSNDPLDPHLKFPLISKLNEIHGSVEIHQKSVSENEAHLRERLKYLFNTYREPVIVEEFIVGRELTGILLEGATRKVYIGEKIFEKSNEKYKMATFEATWQDVNSYDYERTDGHGLLDSYIRTAFDVLKMDDYGKFDVRFDESGRYYFIDCNANPAFGPVEADCAIGHILKMYNIDFDEILRRLIISIKKSNGTVL